MNDRIPLLRESLSPPHPSFALAKKNADGQRRPQAIGHRGYKAAFPENSMAAFEGVVKVGADAIETDVHLTKDGVDKTLKRCFGLDKKIIDCEWSYIETLRTVAEPKQSMPRLLDLLNYVASPGLEHIWVLLDLKMDNDGDNLMRLISETIAQAKPSTPWKERIVLGCWATKFLPHCLKYLPGFPITHIGFSISYARQFLKVPNVSFNMLQKAMVGPWGDQFLAECKALNRPVFLWTVNEEKWMKWSINKGVDGIITDDPKKYLEVAEGFDDGRPLDRMSLRDYHGLAEVWILYQAGGDTNTPRGATYASAATSSIPSGTGPLILLPQNRISAIISPLTLGIPSPALSHFTYSTALNLCFTSLTTPAVTIVPLLPPHNNTGVLAFPSSPTSKELTYLLASPIALFDPAIPVPIAITPPNSTLDHASATARAAIPPCP
ncbi:hypothetical protein V491_02805 [Pseudogymnoascus sp. VKM F-3775]|nr:hypothetical protein V491_02805 [Pseudogymnoascus sp. VKM F-3775]